MGASPATALGPTSILAQSGRAKTASNQVMTTPL